MIRTLFILMLVSSLFNLDPAFASIFTKHHLPEQQAERLAEEKEYDIERIEGWTVHIYGKLRTKRAAKRRALKALKKNLKDLSKRLPSEALKQLRQVRIFCYHYPNSVSQEKQHSHIGYYSYQQKAVVFPTARILARLEDSGIILHELAHAYHDQVIDYFNPSILAAYENAMNKRLYHNIKHKQGRRGKAYATTNHLEYFAEISVAYFSKSTGNLQNGWYPHHRKQLKKLDPYGYKIVSQAWEGKLPQ